MKIGQAYNELKFRVWRLWALLFRRFVADIHLADHCNLNCKSCNHYSPVAEPSLRDLAKLDEDLRLLSRFGSSFGTIRLLGGEPLLHPRISEAVTIVRGHFPSTDIEIVTNGILLAAKNGVNEEFWEACRRERITLAVTEYPAGIDYDRIRIRCRENGVGIRVFGDRTRGNSFNAYKLDPKGGNPSRQYYKCADNSCLQLCEGRIFTCAPSAYAGFLNKRFGSGFEIRRGDYLCLTDIHSSRDIRRFLLRSKPFCRYCILPRESFRWERSAGNADEWIKE